MNFLIFFLIIFFIYLFKKINNLPSFTPINHGFIKNHLLFDLSRSVFIIIDFVVDHFNFASIFKNLDFRIPSFS